MQTVLLSFLAFLQAPLTDRLAPRFEVVRIQGSGRIRPFLIGKYEVTQDQFAGFILETKYDGKDHPSSKPTEQFLQDWVNGLPAVNKGRYPVAYINWFHAKAFCAWLTEKLGREVRLPTDAEWTLAAAGAAGRRFPWGNAWDPTRCNWGDEGKVDGFPTAAPVGSFKRGATPEGAYDMAGNIWEWSAEGNLRGGPWCMDSKTVETGFVAREDTSRCDDKFGLRICMPEPLRKP